LQDVNTIWNHRFDPRRAPESKAGRRALLGLILSVTAAAMGGAPAPVNLTGNVGSFPVRMRLILTPQVSGSYVYLRGSGDALLLGGTNAHGRVTLTESPAKQSRKVTGRWEGVFTNGTFAGTWFSPDGRRKHAFLLRSTGETAEAKGPVARSQASTSPGLRKPAEPLPDPAADWDRTLAEARAHFRHAGEPINPGLVKRFLPWLSDSVPITVEVDVAAGQESNEFSDRGSVGPGGWVTLTDKDEAARGGSLFSYRHLGGLTNGVQVLWVNESGGGSGVFMSLMFIRFSRGTGFSDGRPDDQLGMRCVGQQALGDRYRGEVKLLPGRVRIFPPPDPAPEEEETQAKPLDVRIP